MTFLSRILLLTLATTLFSQPSDRIRLIEVDPGHSHLAGLHTNMLPGVSNEVHIYSPLSPELTSHLAAITRDNARANNPTNWTVRLFAGPDYMAELQKEAPGAIVALSGRNNLSIFYIETALKAGQHVFADKPWIIDSAAFPRLEAALKLAHEHRLITYDWMSLRGETAYRLIRDLAQIEPVFGTPAPGSIEKPSVQLENLHALLKYSNKVPQKRPPAFVDVRQQGEGMADVGTHLADLVPWTLFPNQAISYRKDIHMLRASHTALTMTLDQFTRLTGESTWPSHLKDRIVDGKLSDFTNGTCVYTLKGVHVSLKVGWQYEAPPGESDTYYASYQGTRSLIELRAGPKEHFNPEVYLTPAPGEPAEKWQASLRSAVSQLQKDYPGMSVETVGRSVHLLLPKSPGGNDNLQRIFGEFTGFIRNPDSFPEFENANLLAKYYVTTTAVAMANSVP